MGRIALALRVNVAEEKVRSCCHLLRKDIDELVLKPIAFSSSLKSPDLRKNISIGPKSWYVIVRSITDGHTLLARVSKSEAPPGDEIAVDMPDLRCVLAHPFRLDGAKEGGFEGVISFDSTEAHPKMKWGIRRGGRLEVEFALRRLIEEMEKLIIEAMNRFDQQRNAPV
jgi:hypothetical protein